MMDPLCRLFYQITGDCPTLLLVIVPPCHWWWTHCVDCSTKSLVIVSPCYWWLSHCITVDGCCAETTGCGGADGARSQSPGVDSTDTGRHVASQWVLPTEPGTSQVWSVQVLMAQTQVGQVCHRCEVFRCWWHRHRLACGVAVGSPCWTRYVTGVNRVRTVFEGLWKFGENGIHFSRPWKSVKTEGGLWKFVNFVVFRVLGKN